MRSYEADDLTYRRLQREGRRSWDEQGDPEASFDNFLMRPLLEEALAGVSGGHAMEIGCGTGPIACFLAARGWCVRGIDVSATAIAMAKQHAAERGLAVEFELGDICGLPARDARYDLVVDGHCLHCLVWEEDRRQALAAVGRLLKPEGVFLVETMVQHADMTIGDRYRLDNRGILWLHVDAPDEYADAAMCGGEWFVPHRRILPAEAVEGELRAAGLKPKWIRTVPQKGTGKPLLLQVRCTV